MSFASMIQEILGLPGMNRGLAATKINEAFQLIQDERVWSFQLQTGGWLTPGILGGANTFSLSPGTISVQPYTNQITGDAIASAAWAAASNPFITSYQIRVPYYSLYNIIAYNTIPYPSMFVLSDTVTGQLYSFSVAAGAFQFQTVSFGTSIANPVFYDSSFGIYWMLQVSNGSLSITPTANVAGAIDQYLVTDTVTGLTQAFRVYEGSLQNLPSTTPLLGQLTLDRPWMEPAQVNAGYLAYQAYFAAPPGLKKWLAIRDTTNNQPMNWWTYTQVDLSNIDPQRTDFAEPQYVVPYGPDTRQGSATFGQMLYELWQGPLQQLPYTFQCEAMWPLLSSPNDTVPYPLTEELLKFRTYSVLAAWKESQKGDDMERGSGTNWPFLVKYYDEEYKSRLKKIALVDNQLCELYFTRMNRYPGNVASFVSVNGQMGVGF